MKRLIVFALVLTAIHSIAAETIEASINGTAVSISGQPIEKSQLKSALAKLAKGAAVVVIELDAKAGWGTLQSFMVSASASGITEARIKLPGGDAVSLAIPGADASNGEVVDFPVFDGEDATVLTENDGKKLACNKELLSGLLEQLSKATINVQARENVPAAKVVNLLADLIEAKAAAVAFIPAKEIAALPKSKDKKKGSGADSIRRMSHGVGSN